MLALGALFGVPAALVTLIVLTALTVTRRREAVRQGPGPMPTGPGLTPGAGVGEPVARHAWTAAHLAHARLTQLEARVRQFEARSRAGSDRR